MVKKSKRGIRRMRTRKKVFGTSEKPRLSVFRSNKNIYAQLINDVDSKTLASASSAKSKSKEKIAIAQEVGENLALIARNIKIKRIVFDKSGYKYHGRVKALAEGARKGGLSF